MFKNIIKFTYETRNGHYEERQGRSIGIYDIVIHIRFLSIDIGEIVLKNLTLDHFFDMTTMEKENGK